MALIVSPEPPVGSWLTALDRHLRGSAGFFAERPIVADLSGTPEGVLGQETVLAALDGLAARDLRVIGVEGVDPALLAGTRWGGLPTILHGRDTPRDSGDWPGATVEPSASPEAEPPAAVAATTSPSLLIDRPVRSGQSILFEEGDITIVGSVASGSEVIAGGSIHVYGALRGRAIAGLRTGEAARVFCRKLEAELVGIDQFYRTAENWGPGLHGRTVQIRCDRGALRLSALD
jgi:septum site-determining protein MinC